MEMSDDRFSAEVHRARDETEVRLRGELDDTSVAQARVAIDEALAESPRSLTLALGGLAFMDSAGIWLVIETHRRCVEAGIDMRLAGERQPAVTQALALAGVDELTRQSGRKPPPAAGPNGRVLLRLYLSSRSANGTSVAQAFRSATERLPREAVQMEVIDVFKDPARAQRDRVIATPTLIKVEPGPEMRLIGSLSDSDAILRYLGLGHLVPETE